MEDDEGKEETEASSKAEGKAEGEDKEAKEGEEGAAAGKSDDKEGKKDTDMVKQNEVSIFQIRSCSCTFFLVYLQS